MRNELTAAQQKVKAMQYVVRKAQHNVDVIQRDNNELSCSLAGNVGRLEKLFQHARDMRKDRAQMRVEINAGHRHVKQRLEVHLFLGVLSCFFLFDSTFSCFYLDAACGSAEKQTRKGRIK